MDIGGKSLEKQLFEDGILQCIVPKQLSRLSQKQGFLSPNFSEVSSWCSLFCFEAEVQLMSSALSLVSCFEAGGAIRRSLTSCVICDWRDPTT